MSEWTPQLYLKLDRNQIIREGTQVPGDEKFFGFIEYDHQLRTLCRELVDWLSMAAGTRTKKGDRKKAIDQVRSHGRDIFHMIFDLSNSKRTKTLGDILTEVLALSTEEDPCTIVFEGDWYAFPWEALSVPGWIHGGSGDKFLGELAIIASIRSPESLALKNPFEVEEKLQIVSMKGQPGLTYCATEVAQAAAYSKPGGYVHPHRSVSGLVANGHWSSDQTNCDNIKSIMTQKPPVEFLHGAFHSPTPASHLKFEVDLDKNFRMTSSNMAKSNANFREPNMAFFNTCQGLTVENVWNSGGLAAYAGNFWLSDPIITSICQINDQAACEFSQLLLDRILPTDAPSGEPLGRALYDVRRTMLQEKRPESLIALSYRLIGSPIVYIKVAQEKAA